MAAAPDWIETSAFVTSCRFQAGALRAMAFGLPTPRFRIGFEYTAQGRAFTGEFNSSRAIPQGERIPLCYDPRDPGRNSRSDAVPLDAERRRPSLLLVGIAGSAILSLVWLLVLRSCNP